MDQMGPGPDQWARMGQGPGPNGPKGPGTQRVQAHWTHGPRAQGPWPHRFVDIGDSFVELGVELDVDSFVKAKLCMYRYWASLGYLLRFFLQYFS